MNSHQEPHSPPIPSPSNSNRTVRRREDTGEVSSTQACRATFLRGSAIGFWFSGCRRVVAFHCLDFASQPLLGSPLSQLHKCPLEKKNKRQYTRITYNTELLTILPTKEEMDSSYKITPKNGICAITQKKLCNQIGRENK